MNSLNDVLENIEDGWVIVVDGKSDRVVIDNATYYLKDQKTYDLACDKGYIVECYGEKSSATNVTEIRDNRGNTVWKKPTPRESGEIRKGDYFTRQDIEEYAESEGLDVKDVYQKLMDKMIKFGAERGEGIKYHSVFNETDDLYGWSSESNGCYFSSYGDAKCILGEQLSVKKVVGCNEYVLVNKAELERLKKIANNLGE